MLRRNRPIRWSEQWRLKTEVFAAETTKFVESLEKYSFPQRTHYVQEIEQHLESLKIALAKQDPGSIMENVRKIEMAVCIVQYWIAICKRSEKHVGEEDDDARGDK